MAEIIVNLDNVSVSLAGKPIFNKLSWEIQAGQRIGLVGPNGAGKSTLLKLIAQELEEDDGNIFRKSGISWGRLLQEPELPLGRTLLAETLTAIPERAAIEAQLAEQEAKMSDPAVYGDEKALTKVMNRYDKLLIAHEHLGGAAYESNVKETLSRLGLRHDRWDTLTDHLSGGQKKLVMLAKLVVGQPSLLLLDEPDNHLDLPAKRHLERLIRGYAGCVIIISHDRYLLDEVADHIAELDGGKLTLYPGNYSAYVTERELRRLRQQQLYAAQQKEIAGIEAAIKRFELWASIVVNERHIKQARSRQKMLDKMDRIEEVTESRRMVLNMAGSRGSKKALRMVGVTKQFENGRLLFDNLDFTLWHGERVGLVGGNGVGKSFLFRQLLNPDDIDSGQITIGPSNSIGYYDQEHETLNYNQDLITEIRRTTAVARGTAVSILRRFLFTYEQMQLPISKLSGGERSRLQLAKLMLGKPNLLLLDEPTNNLDIPTIEVLEEVLDEFNGAMLIISHDRYFLDKTVDKIVELKNGRLTEFEHGGYTDYLAKVGI